jgi:tetratricopeptide (TPR) repeat protein
MISPEEHRVLSSFAERIPQADPGAHNNLAIVYYNKGLYREAIEELEKALQLNPNFVLARNNLEIILRKTGRLEEKVEQLSRSIEQDPHDEKQILELANTYVKLNKHSHAIVYYKKVLDANPDSYDAHFGLGTTLKHLGKHDDALDEMNQALEIRSTHEVYRTLGEIYLRKGVVDMAIRNLQEALTLDDLSAETYFLLGFALGEKGRAQESIEAVKKAIALNPSIARGETNIPIDGEAHREHWEFMKEQLGISSTSGDSYQIHYNMGMSYRNKGLFDEAEREFKECLKIKEGDSALYYAIAEADIFLNKFEDAIHNLQRALQRDFDAVKYANALGVAYILLGQFSSALEWFEKVLVQDENAGNALNNVAVAQYNLGDVEQALLNYKKSIDNGNIDAKCNLAMHHLIHGDYDVALELLDDDTADAHFGRGLVFMEQSNDGESLNAFRRVLEIIPHHAGAYYNMGFIATRQGRYEESLSYIRKGMEIEPNYDNEKYHLSLDSALSEFGPYYVPRLQAPATKIVDEVFKPQAESAEELLAEAENLLSKNEVDNALAKVERALSIDSEDSRAVVLKSEILYHHDEIDAAIDLLESYQQDHPDVVEILGSWARMLKEKGETEKARGVYIRLSERERDNLTWLNEVAELSYSLGDEDEALAFYRRLHERDKTNVGANLRLLRIYISKKEFAEAEQYLEYLGTGNQDSYEYNILAGTYWSERKEYEKALRNFDKAIEIDSSQPLPYYHRGLLNVQGGAFESACENWKKALLLSPPEDLAKKIRQCLNLTIELSEILEKEI